MVRVLSKTLSGVWVNGHSVKSFDRPGKSPGLLIELDEPESLSVEKAILIFDSGAALDSLSLKGQFVAVTASENAEAIKLLKKKKIPAITCGMSSKDTVSLSSRGEGSACVCIQREIEALSGQRVEPREVAVKYEGELSEYSIMAATVTLMLCGALPENNSIEL